MPGTQHLRLFIEERLTAAAEEIFGVLEKTISEYEEQVVQSKREVDQLKQDMIRHLNTVKPHIQLCKIDSQPVSKELLPLQQLNPRQELMSSQEDEAAQHQSPRVKKEQVDLSNIPHCETSIYNSGINGFVTSESTSDSHVIPPPYTMVTVQHSTQVKEEHVDRGIIPDSETSISNAVTNGFATSESTSGDSQLIRTYCDDIFCIEQKICRFCRQQFHSYAELMKHVEESHVGHKAFKCPECDREFARKNLWADHYRIHTGVKPHSCPVCGKSFTQVANLKAHMKIHTGVKDHSCPVCGRLFSRSTTLKDHMRVHTGIKPHSCPDCGRLFADRSNLNVHMKIHTGDKPHSCTVCGKSFIQRSCLKTHMKVHTGKKPYLCNKCGETVHNNDHHKGCQM